MSLMITGGGAPASLSSIESQHPNPTQSQHDEPPHYPTLVSSRMITGGGAPASLSSHESQDGPGDPATTFTTTYGPGSRGFQEGISTNGVTLSTGLTFGSDGIESETDVEHSKTVPGTAVSSTQTFGQETITTTTDEYTGTVSATSVSVNGEKGAICKKTEEEQAIGTEMNVTERINGRLVSSVTTGTEYDVPVTSTRETCTDEETKKKTIQKPDENLGLNPLHLQPGILQPGPILGPDPYPILTSALIDHLIGS